MAQMWTMKNGDTRPRLQAGLQSNATTLDLGQASQILMLVRAQSQVGAPQLAGTCSIMDATGGIVQYTWRTGDTATTGTYDAEFEITWNDGGVETVPNSGYFTIVIADDLSD